jgi:divalent anion:Na+ symporter, DASS family
MLWVGSDLDSGLVALLGITLLLFTDTLTWKDIVANTNAVSIVFTRCQNNNLVPPKLTAKFGIVYPTFADHFLHILKWDTLFWLGGFVTIAQQLSDAGASEYLGKHMSSGIISLNLPAVPTLPILYFVTSFMFSSLSTHIVALNVTFMEAAKHLNVNPMLIVPCIAYFSSLGGCMVSLARHYFSLQKRTAF